MMKKIFLVNSKRSEESRFCRAVKRGMVLIFLGFLLLPLASNAAGLVPCGGANEPACQVCHLFVMINGIWSWLLVYILTPVAVLMLMAGGFYMLTAAGDPGRIETGKKILTAAIIGLVLIFGAFLIINMVFQAMDPAATTELSGWKPSDWFKINCQIR